MRRAVPEPSSISRVVNASVRIGERPSTLAISAMALEAPPELVSKYRRRFPDRGLFAIYAAMVEQLEQVHDATVSVSGEDLATEIERFLREEGR